MASAVDTTTSHDITTDAGFRAWVAAWHTIFTSIGLVQTGDTGQIDTATVTTPASEMTAALANAAGYSIWRFDDPDQATVPVFLKFTWGRGDLAGQTRVAVQVGTGSNGSGTLTNVSGHAVGTTGGAADSADRIMLASYEDGAFFMLETANRNTTSTAPHQIAIVERVHDASGSADGRLVAHLSVGANNQSGIYSAGWSSTNIHIVYEPAHDPTGAGAGVLWAKGCPRPFRSVAFSESTGAAIDDTGTLDVGAETRAYRALMQGQYIGGLTSASAIAAELGSSTTTVQMRLLARTD
jgi:hypothetical protein